MSDETTLLTSWQYYHYCIWGGNVWGSITWRKSFFGISLQKRISLCCTVGPTPVVRPVLTPCSWTAARHPMGDPSQPQLWSKTHKLACLSSSMSILGHQSLHCRLLIRWRRCQCCHRISFSSFPSVSPLPRCMFPPPAGHPTGSVSTAVDALPNEARTWLKNNSEKIKKGSGWEFLQLPSLLKSMYHKIMAPAKGWPSDCYSSHDSAICDCMSRLKENKASLWS